MTTNRRLDPVTHDAVTDLAERSLDDDHYYGAWSQGRGGRGSPASAAQVRSASKTSLATSVREFEDSVRGNKLETVAAFNAQGQMVEHATGERDHVAFKAHAEKRPVVITHNHPTDTAASPFDMTSAIYAPTIREVRTVGAKNTYILRPGPQGFFPGATEKERWVASFDYAILANKVKHGVDKDLGLPDNHRYSDAEAQMVSSRFWDIMAPKMGWSLQKVPHAG